MKNKNVINLSKCKIIFTLIVLSLNVYSQSSSIAPKADWKAVTWREKDLMNNSGLSQALSGDEWWYSHKNLYDPITGKHIGYIACGYIADLVFPGDETKMRTVFNEGSNSPYNQYPIANNPFLVGIDPNDCGDFLDIMNSFTTNPTPSNANYRRTMFRGIVARLDLKGNMIWCKLPCISGDGLQELILDGGFIYTIGAHVGVMNLNFVTPTNPNAIRQPLSYNPVSVPTKTSQTLLGAAAQNETQHMYVAKFDLDGNKIWESLYGDTPWNSASVTAIFQTPTPGWDIIKNSDGNLYAVGQGSTNGHNAFVAKIDPTFGYLLSSTIVPLPDANTYSNGYNEPLDYFTPRSICEIGTSTKMAIGGVGRFVSQHSTDLHRAVIYSINNNLSLNTNWAVNPRDIGATSGLIGSSNCWEVNYHAAKQEVLVGVLNNCDACLTSGDNHAEGQILRLVGANGNLASGTNPSLMGPINAYDLRIGVIETVDGGFAAISSKRHTTPPPISLSQLGTFSTCPNFNAYTNSNTYGTWDTDPLIVKFDASGNKTWEWNEDIVPGRARQLTPGDFKRQECMYKISQAFDGGLVASGNCSYNIDDNYIVKLGGDCGLGITYDLYGAGSGHILSFGTTYTISNSLKINGKIIVGSGCVLTITGTNTIIRFADGKQVGYTCGIEVQPGGTLKLENGATLTSIDNTVCPGSMWDGVAVVGNPNLFQNTTDQGKVYIYNGTISNARCGITTGFHENTPAGRGGGIVDVFDGNFINNERDIEILTYNKQYNISRIRKSQFIINNELNNRYNPVFRIYMENILNPKLEGNVFKYNAGNAYDWNSRGWGVYSNNTAYTIKDYATSNATTQTLFQDLSMGLEADNCGQNLRTVNIDHAIFNSFNSYGTGNKNWTGGINLHSVNNAQITRNTIVMQDVAEFGISVNNSKLYTIKNNTLTGLGQLAQVGIYASNSGSGNHKIYRNNFTNLDGGIYSQYNNANMGDPSNGLIMNCNTFSGNKGDVAMLSDDNNIIPTVRKNQGFGSNNVTFVRNKYTAVCTYSNQWYIDNVNPTVQVLGSNYEINHTSFATSNGSFSYTPSSFCKDFLLITTASNNNPSGSDCPAEDNVPNINNNPISNIQDALSSSYNNVNYLQTEYNNNLDGGHSITILNQIADPNLDETTLFNHINYHDAFLSDAVLTAYFTRATVPFHLLKSIHNNNKPVTPSVWTVLQGLALNQNEMDELTTQQAENTESVRKAAENELGNAKSNLQNIYGQKLNYYLLDSTETSKDTVLALVDNNLGNLPEVDLLKVAAYAHKGNYSAAFTLANTLSSNQNLAEEINLEKALLELDTSAAGLGKIKDDLSLYTTISDYAYAPNKKGHYKALAVMQKVFGVKMDLHYLAPPINQSRSANNNLANNEIAEPNQESLGFYYNNIGTATSRNKNAKQTQNLTLAEKTNIKNAFEFKMYPNPANNNVTFFVSSRSSDIVNVEIVDVLGKHIYSGILEANKNVELNTQEFKNGLYFVSLIQNNLVLENQKLTIMK